MASPQVTLRIPPALLALIDAECDRRGISRTDVILDALADQLGKVQPEPAPRSPQPRTPPPGAKVASVPKPAAPERVQAAKVALAKAEENALPLAEPKGRGGAAMEAAGVMQWDPSAKRPQYQKGLGAQGKAKRR